jgi:Bacterial PH domain
MERTCPNCGENQVSGIFCSECGTALNKEIALSKVTVLPPKPKKPSLLQMLKSKRPDIVLKPKQSMVSFEDLPEIYEDTDENKLAKEGEFILETPEKTLWTARPHMLLMIPRVLQCISRVSGVYLVMLLISPVFTLKKQFQIHIQGVPLHAVSIGFVELFVGIFLSLLYLLYSYFFFRSFKYKITHEQFHLTIGLFNESTHFFELNQLSNMSIYRPFSLRLLGLSNLHIPHTGLNANSSFFDRMMATTYGQDRTPSITVYGLKAKHAEGIHKLIRHAGRKNPYTN